MKKFFFCFFCSILVSCACCAAPDVDFALMSKSELSRWISTTELIVKDATVAFCKDLTPIDVYSTDSRHAGKILKEGCIDAKAALGNISDFKKNPDRVLSAFLVDSSLASLLEMIDTLYNVNPRLTPRFLVDINSSLVKQKSTFYPHFLALADAKDKATDKISFSK